MQIFTLKTIKESINSLALAFRHLKTLVLLNSTGRQEPIRRKSWLFVSGRNTLSLILFCLSLSFTGSVFSQANFVASPASVTINPGDPFSVTIALQTGNNQTVDGAEIHLDFDPSILQVTSVAALSSTQLPTEILGAPTFNNSTGTISYVAGNVSSPPLANFDFLQIEFQAIGSLDTSIDYVFSFPLRLTDITLEGFSVFGAANNIPVTIAGVNQPPVFNNTIANQTNNELDIISLDASATDPELDVITYSATGLPSGLDINTSTGEIFGTVDVGAANINPYPIIITATDNGSPVESATLNFNWTVQTAVITDTEPVIALDATASVGEGGTINVPLSISDADGDNLTVTITSVSNEPQELQTGNTGAQTDPYPYDAANFLTETSISNNPGSYSSSLDFAPQFGDGGSNGDGSGVYTVTVEVADEDGNSITQDIDVTVTDVAQFIADTGTTRLEAESYDDQGNTGGGDGIGVEVGTITNIGFTTNGDFAEYIIDVQTAGTYQFDFYVSKNSATTNTMTINGGPTSITVPNYSDWADYSNVVSANVTLPAGSQTLRFDWSGPAGNYFNIDYFEATKVPDGPFQLCIASGSAGLNAFGRTFVGDPATAPPTGLGFGRTNGKLYAGYNGAIAGTLDAGELLLFQKEIYGGKNAADPAFSYDIPVSPGYYMVELYFAEVYHPSAGGRIFDVFLEGNLLLDEYDLVNPIKDGLGVNQTAITRTYYVEVTDGSLNVQIGPASTDNGKISGICVTEVSSANLHPVASIGDLTYDALVAVADPLDIVDPESDVLSVVLNGMPASLTYNPATNQLEGTILATDANTYTINAIISDGTNSPVTEEFTLVINPPAGDDPPVIDAISDVAANEGEAISIPITVTDDTDPSATIEIFDVSEGGTNDPFTPTSEAAVGSLTDNSGGSYTFNWTPATGEGRSYLAVVSANDGVNPVVTESFRIDVAQQLPGTILARTFNNPIPWYGSSAPGGGLTVAIETSVAKNIGYIDNGDFVEYLINVPVAGLYDVEIFAGKGNTGTTVVTLSTDSGGGFTALGSVNVIQTGWQTYASYTTQVNFTGTGLQTFRLDFNGGANVRDFNFTKVSGNTPPVVTILTPADGIGLTTGTSLNFTASVTDVEDDDATLTAALSWSSDLDGSLGTGGNIPFALTTVGTHTITAEITDLDAITPLTGTASITLVVTGTDPSCDARFRVNAGGPVLLAGSGDFEEDQAVTTVGGTAQTGTPSTYVNTAPPAFDKTFGSTDALVSNTTGYPDFLFQTERYSDAANPDNMQWSFPTGDGIFDVKILFNENWTGEAGNPRVFDVEIEGDVALDDYRPSVDGTQINIAKVEIYQATVTDGVLNIDFIKGTQNPSVKGFDICFVSDLPTDTPPVVTISSPTDNTTPISINRLVSTTFTAAVIDQEDDNTTLTNALVWSIDPFEANFAGSGGTFDDTILVPGVYTIRASSTDSDANTALDEIQVTVLGPDVEFTSPLENADLTTTDVQVTWTATNMNYGGATPEHFHLWVNPADPNNLVPEDRISTASFSGQLFWDLTAADGIVEGSNKVIIIAADNGHAEFLNAEARDEVNFNVLADSTDPTIVCPTNIVVDNDPGLCGADVTFTAPVGADDRPGAVTTQTAGLASGAFFPVGTTTQTFLVTDAAGLTATCSFDVTVNDTEDPILTCPADDSVDVDTNGEFVLADYTGLAAVSDNCDNSFTVTQSPVPGSTLSVDTEVTLSVTDAAGNTGTCAFNVTIADDITNPIISCPSDIVVDNDADQCGAAVTFTAPVGTDERPGASTFQLAGLNSGDVFPLGITTQTYEVVDGAGNRAQCSFTVTVNDSQAPSIICPTDILVNSPSGSPVVIEDIGTATATDNCPGLVNIEGVTLIGNQPIPDTFSPGNTQILWTATDAAGNIAQCVQDVVVNFTPSTEKAILAFSLPGQVGPEIISGTSVNLTVALGTDLSAPVIPSTIAISDYAMISPDAGAPQIFNVPVEYTVTAQDASSQVWTVNVSVEPDNEAPSITCPADIIVSNDPDQCGAVVTFSATATDNQPGVTLGYSVPSGSLFGVGTTTVLATATDGAGNMASCSFDITVNDTEAPVVSCLVNQTEQGDINGVFAIPDYTGLVSALDNCEGPTLVTQDPIPGTIISGTTTVTMTSLDAAGNSGSCTFDVIVDPLPTATLGDKVFEDVNKDGIQDAGEPGVPGVTVSLQDCSGNTLDITATDANGEYSFTNLAPGDYVVVFDNIPSGYEFSNQNVGGDDVLDSDAGADGATACITLAPGMDNDTVDAGISAIPASIGDYVFEDLDKDGIQDPGEAGVPGVTVTLLDCLGFTLATTTTDSNGRYNFTNLAPGGYVVVISNIPSGFEFSIQDAGGDDSSDSDAGANGATACITLAPGEDNDTVDAGIRTTAPSQLIITPTSISRTLNVGASTMVNYVVDSDDASTLPTPAAMSIIDDATSNPATWASTTSAANQGTTYEVNLDATGLAPGTYTAILNAGPVTGFTDASIPITMMVMDPLPTVLAVTSFTLVNAENEQDIMTITNGMTIDVTTLPTLNLNIRANTTSDVESVQLQLTGALSQTMTENVAPYALYGDSSGNYAAQTFVIGNYSLTGNPYSGNSLGGTFGTPLTVNFELADQDPVCVNFNASLTGITNPSTCGGFGSATIVPSQGVSPYTYQWDNGETTATVNNLVAGPHSVTVVDANGCSKTLNFTLTGPPLPNVTLAPFANVLNTAPAFTLTGGLPVGGTYSGAGVIANMFNPAIGVGTYPITYSYTDSNGCSNTATRSITVTTATSNAALIVLDATDDSVLFALTNGLQINKNDIGNTPLGIIYNTSLNPGGVQFNLTGPINENRYEGPAPHSLFGDKGVNILGKPFPVGNYTLIANPNSGPTQTINFSVIDGPPGNQSPVAVASGTVDPVTPFKINFSSAGSVDPDGTIFGYLWNFGDGNTSTNQNPSHTYATGGSKSVSLTVTDNEGATGSTNIQVTAVDPNDVDKVVTFTLVDAVADDDIIDMTNNYIINNGTGINIRANTDPGVVGSVKFVLSGAVSYTRTESVAPYALYGDASGNYIPTDLPIGLYTLTATPYSASGANGTAGQSLTINFSVGITPLAAKTQLNKMSIAPNPANEKVTMSFEEPTLIQEILIFDITGKLIRTIKEPMGLDAQTIDFKVYDLPIGSYFIKTVDSKGIQYQQQMVIDRY